MAQDVMCKFSGGGAAASRSCEGKAVRFARAARTGRLCPLCGPCLKAFEDAQARVRESARSERPDSLGELGYTLVELDAGAQEWAAQPART